MGGKEGEGGMHEEGSIETYTTICKIDSQWKFAVCLGELKLGLCDNLEGWEGDSRGRGHMYGLVAKSCPTLPPHRL